MYLCCHSKDAFFSWWFFVNNMMRRGSSSSIAVELNDALSMFSEGFWPLGPF